MKTLKTLKALSIRQPWAWLIVNDIKNIENRNWKTNFRGQILIHASKKIDYWAYDKIKHGLPEPHLLKTGGIVGITTIVDCVSTSKSIWFTGKFGFKLKNSKPLPFIPCKGNLSFFKPAIP